MVKPTSLSPFKRKGSGFSIVELMVILAIIAVLVGIAIPIYFNTRKGTRDKQRLADMRTIQEALERYYEKHGRYPSRSGNHCHNGWETCDNGEFIPALVNEGFLEEHMIDPSGPTSGPSGCGNYRYYRYGAGGGGLDPAKGAFYVLGIKDMETSGRPHSDSPGWLGPTRDWQEEFDWVTGSFEQSWVPSR